MTIDEKLDLLLNEVTTLKQGQQEMKSDMTDMKSDITDMKSDMTDMKSDITDMKSDITDMKSDITDVKMSLENETNRNIQLLAENHMNLVDKLNQAIRVSDKTTLYEIQVNILRGKVENLEKEVENLKSRTA